jgi:aryl-alcohol dehydrogenase-like predicted oxidoreductase
VLYGFGRNEELIGATLKNRRHEFVLASKCGMFRNAEGRRAIDGRPAVLKQTCEDSLRRLQTDVIDLYYLHRVDPKVPLEDSLGALVELVAEGKIKAIGLSEVSEATLRRAHALHPIAALQSEYSLWTRNPEISALTTCRELGIAFVAFSPLGRGFLPGAVRLPADLAESDIRRGMPRFRAENFTPNLALLDKFAPIAAENDCTMAQLALAWVLAQGSHIVPIPGTANLAHVEENARAPEIRLDGRTLRRMEAVINTATVAGARYDELTQREIGTEKFALEA